MLTINKEAIFSSFVSIIAVLLLSKGDPIPGRDKLRGRLATQIFNFFSSLYIFAKKTVYFNILQSFLADVEWRHANVNPGLVPQSILMIKAYWAAGLISSYQMILVTTISGY